MTKNSADFRGPADSRAKGQYADVEIHAGLICLNGPPSMDLDMQIELFEQAVEELYLGNAQLFAAAVVVCRLKATADASPTKILIKVRTRSHRLGACWCIFV